MKIKLSLTALMLFLTFYSYSQEIVFSSGDFDFEVLGNNSTVQLKALDGTLKGDITIPDSVSYKGKNYAVTRISTMGDNPNVQSLWLPKTVVDINSLSSLSGLQNIYVDESNPYYKSVEGLLVTKSDMGLTLCPYGRTGELAVPEGIVRINTSFHSGINKLKIPSSVTYVNSYIGSYITEFEVADNNAQFKSVKGVLYSKDGKVLIAYPATNESVVSIPSNVDSISTYAFHRNIKIILDHITPPSIGYNSLYDYNTNISCIFVKKEYLNSYQTNTKTSKYDLIGFDIIKDSIIYAKTSGGDVTVVGSYSLSTCIDIPQKVTDELGTFNVTGIDNKAFFQNYNLINIYLPETLTSIGDSAFYNTSLQEITFPSSLTKIGKHAFIYCYDLYNVYAKCAPIDISAGCFSYHRTLYVPSQYEDQYRVATGWNNFSVIVANDFIYGDFVLKKLSEKTLSIIKYTGTQTDITIPDEVTIDNKNYRITAIGKGAFESKNLTCVKLPKWLEEIGENAFRYNYDLTSIDFPASLKVIGKYAFYNCSILTINIPNTIETIDDNAFSSNYDLGTIIIDSEKPCTLGNYPFYSNGNFKILVPSPSADTYKTSTNWNNYSNYIYGIDAIIEDIAYQKLDNQTVSVACCLKNYYDDEYNKLTIPKKVIIDGVNYNVTSIGEGAFSSAYYLNELTLQESIDSIGSRAFNYNIIIRLGNLVPPKTNNNTFYNYPQKVIVPFAALESYKTAENWQNLSDIIIAYDALINGVAYLLVDNSHAAVCSVLSMPDNNILEIPEKIEFDSKTYTVSTIAAQAFNNISGNLLSLPQTIDSIGENANYGVFNMVYLKSVTPPRLGSTNYNIVYVPYSAVSKYQSNTQWVPYEGYKDNIHGTDGIICNDSVLYNINNTAKKAELCKWMKANSDIIDIPSTIKLDERTYSVTSLQRNAFNGSYAKTMKIPATITNIEDYALPTTSDLIVMIEATTPPTIGYHYNWYLQRQSLYVYSNSYQKYRTANVWKDFGNIVAIDTSDNLFYYAKLGNGKAVVTGLKTATNTEVEIPETVVTNGETLKVTQIGSKLFMNNRYLQKITIPITIETIGERAFYGSTLQQVTIPASVSTIGDRAFSSPNTSNYLNKIQVRAGNEYFMQRNEKLLLSKDGKKLIQTTRSSISPSYSYGYNKEGQYVRIESNPLDGIEEIAPDAMNGCQTSSIKLPVTLKDIDASFLMYMSSLSSIEVDTQHQKLCSIDGILFSKDTTSIIYFPFNKSRYSDYKNYELPEKVQNIGKLAFYNSQFESLTLSDSLKLISDSAFYCRSSYSNQIGSLILMNDKIAKASETAFNNYIYQNTILYVPMGTQNEYLTTSPWSKFRNVSSSKLAEEDFLLLKAFYEEMGNGEGWYRQWTFGASADETRITRGIRMVDDHVYSIDLSSNNLTGGLSDKLFKLPRLQILNLSNNKLSCPIDSVLNKDNINNTVLRELDISYNQLTGNIGSVTNTLKNLTTLNASRNKLSQVTPMLPSRIINLSLNNQVIDTVDFKSLCLAAKEYVEAGQPNIIFYNHNYRNYSLNNNIYLQNTDDSYWIMSLKNTDGIITASEYSSSYRVYKRPNGDILQLASNNGTTGLIRMWFDYGDVNFDTNVNVSDLQLTVNYAVSDKAEQLFNFTASDIQTDNWVNVQDVVCLVNILLDQHIDTNSGNGARTRTVSAEDADALLYWQGNKLVLKCDRDIAALDIAIENAKDVRWLLDDVDYDFIIDKQKEYIRIIHYSMAGKNIKAGEKVIAEITGQSVNILKADIVNKDGILVKTACMGTPTSIEDTSSDISDINVSANISGVNIMSSQPMANLKWAVYSIGGNLLGRGVSDLSSGISSLHCNLAGESQVIVRLSNNNINITKKVSIIK